MPKITNISKAPQGVNTLSGVVYLHPGESRDDLEFSIEEGMHLKTLPFLHIASLASVEGAALEPADDRSDLKKQAGELGIDFPRNVTTEKLKELIDAKLAE